MRYNTISRGFLEIAMDLLFLAAAVFSEIVGTIAGFGSSTIFLPLSLLFFDFPTSLVLVAILHVFGNLSRISFFRHGLNPKTILTFGIPSVFASLVGALLVSYTSQLTLKGVLGLFLALFSIISFWKENIKIEMSLKNSIVGGGLSGFFAGLIGTGGALRGLFLTSFGLSKEKYIASAAAIAIAVDITRIPVYIRQGFLDTKYYFYIPALFLAAIAGSFLGKKIVKMVPQKIFNNIVHTAIFLIGLKFIYDWILV